VDRDRYDAVHIVSDWMRIAFHLRNNGMPVSARYIAEIIRGLSPNERVQLQVNGHLIGRIVPAFVDGSQPPIPRYTPQPSLFEAVPTTAPPVSIGDAVDAWLRKRQT
jgi:hypothetical protein